MNRVISETKDLTGHVYATLSQIDGTYTIKRDGWQDETHTEYRAAYDAYMNVARFGTNR